MNERRTLIAVITISIILISLVVGYVDLEAFGGSTSILNPATAIATIVAFILLVIYDENSGKYHKLFLESSLIAAVILDALKLISLVALVPPRYRVSLEYFVFAFLEKKNITIFATQPYLIPSRPFTAKSLAIDPVPLMLLGYYLGVVRRREKSLKKK